MLRSLFWKIFASILIANVLAMVSAIYYFTSSDVSEQFYERYKARSFNMAQNIIERTESGQPVRPFKFGRRGRGIDGPRPGRILPKRLLIIDDQDQVIFGKPAAQHEDYQRLIFNYQSNSGRQYQIEVEVPQKPSVFKYLSRRIQSIRFAILFLATIIVSFILSLLIVRPLKQLGKHARNLAGGDMQSRVEKNLLKRRDEIGDLSREFNEMASTLDKLISSKQQLLHDVSHELRAPLARLQAIAAIMQQQDDASPATAERIERECNRMNALIQEILEYSRLQYDLEDKLVQAPVNLFELLTNLVANVQLEFPAHPIQFKQIDVQLVVMGHINMLDRAFENILRNACKHTPEQTSIDLCVQSAEPNVEIIIRDHGPGIYDVDLANLTIPFFRASGTKQTEGYGLGLSISQRIIKRHQGTLKIKNHAQGGLLILVVFPMANCTNSEGL